jgi:hypothetical protein
MNIIFEKIRINGMGEPSSWKGCTLFLTLVWGADKKVVRDFGTSN